MRVPILRGPLRGRWWSLLSPGQPGRVLGGSYEPHTVSVLGGYLRPGDTMLDLGAHAGYFTLLGAKLVGPGGRVWAFEPSPRNCRYLRHHVAINRCSNVFVEEVAVSNRQGSAGFAAGSGSGTGRLREGGPLTVPTVTLDAFCSARSLVPSLIKIDVEGEEVRVLEGAARVIAEHGPIILLSTHGDEIHAGCVALLEASGYALLPMTGADRFSTTELLCLPARSPSDGRELP
jgi:FkbM family methyltransferase